MKSHVKLAFCDIKHVKTIAMSKRLTLFLAWFCVASYAFPFLWEAFATSDLPLAGLRGVLKPWVGIPSLLLAIIAVIILSFPRFERISVLLVWGGVLSTAGFISVMCISNSGGMGLILCGVSLIRLGRELLEKLEKRSNLQFDADAVTQANLDR